MAEQLVRVGIVGAGANTRARHIPGFRAIPGVEVLGVVNRTPASTARAASELEIPRTYPDWQALIADPQIDAVCIGTWPSIHCEITCAALAAGKHVLTEARMARDLAEARQMLAASHAHPKLVAQIVPSPFGLEHIQSIQGMFEWGFFGELREVVVIGADDMFWDYSQPLHWRQDATISGKNILTLGILHETLLRFCPPPTKVFAQTALFEPKRPHPERSGLVPVTVPDCVHILTEIEGGARGIYHFSGTALFGPGKQIHIYGRRGTIKLMLGQQEQLWAGRMGESEMQLVNVPPEIRGSWRVEAEFIGAIRGQEKVKYTDFPTGVQYMEFLEAVARSAQSAQTVSLPLVS